MLLALGADRVDLGLRALVLAAVEPGADLLDTAGRAVVDGADLLLLGRGDLGPDDHGLGAAVEAVRECFDVSVGVETASPFAAAAAARAGAVLVRDATGATRPALVEVAVAEGLTLVAGAPRAAAPHQLAGLLTATADRLVEAGAPTDRLVLDAGLDLVAADDAVGRLQALPSAVALGWPVLAAVPAEGLVTGSAAGLPAGLDARGAELAAHAAAITFGAHLLVAHDVRAARRVVDVVAAIRACLVAGRPAERS